MKIFLDESKIFKCKLKVEGTTLSKSKCRLLLKTGDLTLMYEGKIHDDGQVEVNIPKLKKYVETKNGTAQLEVIADDTVFTPFTENIEFTQKYVVEVVTEAETTTKPSVKLVTAAPNKTNNYRKALAEIITELQNKKITGKTIAKHSKYIVNTVNEKRMKYKLSSDFINYTIENIPKYIK